MDTGSQFDEQKFDELFLYLAQENHDDPSFGKTKLNKLLFFADFTAYRVLRTSITGATYQKRPYGPVPMEIRESRSRLVAGNALRVQERAQGGWVEGKDIPLREPDLSVFTAEELAIVDAVIEQYRGMSAGEISDRSPHTAGWKYALDNEVIPYHTVFLADDQNLTFEDIEKGQILYQQLLSLPLTIVGHVQRPRCSRRHGDGAGRDGCDETAQAVLLRASVAFGVGRAALI